MALYNKISFQISELITKQYSTSFSLAISVFDKETRNAIYSIYGFVRAADEIVDTFHEFDKKYLIEHFEIDYNDAVKHGISLNHILNAFQFTVKKYAIPDEYVRAFLNSMKCDIEKTHYMSQAEMCNYIYGSADVVGLMCLKVFCSNNELLFNELKEPAMKLGTAFQKVNFLRDLKNDIDNLHRFYFPELIENKLDEEIKIKLVKDIYNDFILSYKGIKRLPGRSKFAVLVAFYYYRSLLRKISHSPAMILRNSRIRISNIKKIILLIKAAFFYKFNLV